VARIVIRHIAGKALAAADEEIDDMIATA